MNLVLSDMLGNQVLCYQDDIIVFSKTKQEHMKAIEEVLKRLRQANLKAKPSKCSFLKDSVKFLGHIVNSTGIMPDEKNLQSIQDFEPPKNVKGVQSFLRMLNYYRKYIPGCAEVSIPLTYLTKKRTKFLWNAKCQESFDTLKVTLLKKPCLRHPEFTKPFIIFSDASDKALRAVLEQEFEDGQHPLHS